MKISTFIGGVALRGPIPSNQTAAKISAFLHLTKGWDYGRGGPLSPTVVDEGLFWNSYFRILGADDTNAFPGADGELVVSATFGDDEFEIIVEPDLNLALAHDRQGKQISYVASLNREGLIRQLGGARKQWNSFAFYTPINMTRSVVSGAALHFATPSKTTASPSSAPIASNAQPWRYAITSRNTSLTPA